MPGQGNTIDKERLFHAAAELADPALRAVFLDAACAGDPALRAELEELLRHDADAGTFLSEPALGPGPGPADDATTPPPPEPLAARVGPYKLLQAIGEGGMGTVFLAEQTAPVRRLVALKVIKPGMDSRQVLARFDAERQALALMDHPNIARVLDAGATDQGRPYFVMELVKGQPITRYCDEKRLTPRERLELLIPVCQAVQHAHQKGVIHRDLKPSNVLVGVYDGQPVPKVIDFGVAKATGQKLTEATLFTGFGAVVGTPEYMSPEQAQLDNLDIDTRSDVYALGVLLYELLTGTTPLDRKRLKQAALLEVLRFIREEEPPRPSTRLSTTEELPSIAACRGVEPRKLSGLMRGELDWIVMKALEKDRSRRYETATGLAADLRRYLDDEPVQACPPSVRYRFGKFVRRNKRALAASTLLILALLVAVGGITGGIGWALRDRAYRRAEIARQVASILDEVERLEREQRWPEALDVARRAEAVVAGGEGDPASLARVRRALADLEMVARLEEVRLRSSELFAEPGGAKGMRVSEGRYEEVFREYGVDVESLPAPAAADRLRPRAAVAVPIAAALDDWALRLGDSRTELRGRLLSLAATIDPDPWRCGVRRAAAKDKDISALAHLAEAEETDRQPPQSLLLLAAVLDRPEQQLALLLRAREKHPDDLWIRKALGKLYWPGDPQTASHHFDVARALRPRSTAIWSDLGVALGAQGKREEAIACCRRAIALDPKSAPLHTNLGSLLQERGQLEEAIACHRRAIALDPKSAGAHNNLGNVLKDQGKHDEAIAEYFKAIALDPKITMPHTNLGALLKDQGRLDEAIAEHRKAIALDPKFAGAHNNLGDALRARGGLDEAIAEFRTATALDPRYAVAHANLGTTLGQQGKFDEAIAEYRRAIELDPKDTIARNGLGIVLYHQGKVDEAIAEHRKAIALDPRNAHARHLLMVDLAVRSRADEALAAYRAVTRLNLDNPEQCAEFAAELMTRGQTAAARTVFEDQLKRHPANPELLNAIAWSLATTTRAEDRDPRRAIELAREATQLAPRAGGIWNTLGVAYYRAGDFRAAIEALERSTELQGESAHDLLFLSMARWRLGEKEAARTLYGRAVDRMEKDAAQDPELVRFRAEAAGLLGVGATTTGRGKEPGPPEKSARPTDRPTGTRP